MSAFEVTITPTRFKKIKPSEGKEPTDVIMAPFSAKSIVQFEDVPVTKTAKRILRIINTADVDIEVKVTKAINPVHNITINWVEKTIPALNEVEMEMIWNPQLEVVCKETMQLTDNRNFRKDVMIILKTKSNMQAKNTRKFPTMSTNRSSYTKTLRLKSPTNANKLRRNASNGQTQKRAQNHKEVVKPKWTNPLPQSTAHTMRMKATSTAKISPLVERNNYLKNVSDRNISPIIAGDENHKENVSPLTPGHVMDLIDDLKFTPMTEKLPKPNHKLDSLVFLPTPVSRDSCEKIERQGLRDVRPRRLSAIDFTEDDDNLAHSIPIIKIEDYSIDAKIGSTINNKTFNIKHTDIPLDIVEDTVDLVQCEVQLSNSTTMNKTTTVVSSPLTRQLTIIAEEESVTTSNTELQKTYSKVNEKSENLKRDVQLVGTPLQKHSKSMKDLVLKSPQTKFGIQGSLPNLNEMETIRSIEQNRYFYQNGHKYKENNMSVIYEQNSCLQTKSTNLLNTTNDTANSSQVSIISCADLLFNQNEILAQSSHLNINEVGLRSHRKTPAHSKFQTNAETDNSHARGIKKNTADESVKCKKRKSKELSICDSPSNDSTIELSTKSMGKSATTPPKRFRVDNSPFQRSTTFNASSARGKMWAQAQQKKIKLSTTLSLVKKPITPRKKKDAPSVKLYDTDLYLQQCINPDPFAATTTCDPFLASTMYLDERAIEKHQKDFKKWLNALVSLPADLNVDRNTKIDVGKLFNEVRNKELILAPTKEEQSMNYLTKFRLESLRNAAVKLYFSDEMRTPCSNVAVHINKNDIRIRSDRNLHLDVVMQRYILELLLCFNPLWLRLGLEVVFGETIHLSSNSDIVGLSTFILNRLFRDKFKEQQYSRAYTLSDEYADYIKKHTLRKTLFLLLFLDKAKTKRIVKHNPCLFIKKSPYKETREILLRFSSELLANIGDITRELKRHGYMLQHKQSYLDEFDYAFNNLAVDLRDGVRLTRVMEIILLRDDMTKQLRVPAISRLQRIFNVNLALRALSDTNFELRGDITAGDIVDGHCEKTLSLLWQIIYKFRSPKFHEAAKVLQKWWRNLWLRVTIRRRIIHKELLRRQAAATKIQAQFRGHITRKYVEVYRKERTSAAILLQKHMRGILARKRIYKIISSALIIQCWYRAHVLGASCRRWYNQMKTSSITVQRCYRRRLLAKKLLNIAREEKVRYVQQRNKAAQCIQHHWQAYHLGTSIRKTYLKQKASVIVLQRQYRAIKAMRVQHAEYLQLRETVIKVQKRYRAKKLMVAQRQNYLQLCRTIRMLQTRYRAFMLMKQQRSKYQRMRQSVICIQRKWQATLLARRICANYISLQYHTTVIQQKFRCRKLMREQSAKYQELRNTCIIIQRRFRANIKMRECRAAYQLKLQAVGTIQNRYRAYKQMRYWRAKYRGIREATICIQQYTRCYLQMKRERADFLNQKRAVVVIQKYFRAFVIKSKVRNEFVQLKKAAINLQNRYRATLLMRKEMQTYQSKRSLIIFVQQRYKAKLLGRIIRTEHKRKIQAIITLQQRLRATQLMHRTRQKYIEKRNNIIIIQKYYRCYRATRAAQAAYQLQRASAIKIQEWYRSILHMRRQRSTYLQARKSIMQVQQRWRATLAMRRMRQQYLHTKQKITFLQCKLRATICMRNTRQTYIAQRAAAIVLQQRYRARLDMLKMRSQYLLIHSLILCIQRKFRAQQAMLVARANFLQLKRVTIHLQQKFRGRIQMREERKRYVNFRSYTLNFQAYARGFLARKRYQALMTPEMIEFIRQKKAAKLIQRFWRGYLIRKRFHSVRILTIRNNIKMLKESASALQSVRFKVLDSVRILRGRFCVSDALQVLMRLDRISRTVPHLLMSHSDFISNFCYGIMAQAIRSEVDKQLIEYSSRIILNLARYNSTTANTFQEGGLVTIAQMLLRWCDKDCDIFNTLCTLIWIFAHSPQKREIIRKFMTTSEAIYMVRETKKLVARKEKMKQNIRKPVNSRTQKTNFSSRTLPSLEADYGVVCNRPYIFISSVYAFETILYKLDINII